MIDIEAAGEVLFRRINLKYGSTLMPWPYCPEHDWCVETASLMLMLGEVHVTPEEVQAIRSAIDTAIGSKAVVDAVVAGNAVLTNLNHT